jgi:hypothetical protein
MCKGKAWFLAMLLLQATGCSTFCDGMLADACRQLPAPSTPPSVDFSFLQPLSEPHPSIRRLCETAPSCDRERLHLYFVNGLDPLYAGNFRGLGDYVKSLGFTNVYLGQLHHCAHFRQSIVNLKREEPNARIVLLGYSVGANAIRAMAHSLEKDHVEIESLVYVGGDTIKNEPFSRPPNVRHILNINGHGALVLGYGLYYDGDNIDGAENHRVDVKHLSLPAQTETAEILTKHLMKLCVECNGSVNWSSGRVTRVTASSPVRR